MQFLMQTSYVISAVLITNDFYAGQLLNHLHLIANLRVRSIP